MNQPLKTILIDDEPLAISRLRRLLISYADDIQIVGEAANGAEALTLIERDRPDLIFLDIEMPLLNGFELLARLTRMPLVVFATAYDQYAIRAFEENSVDYLLKPVEADRLARTVARLRTHRDREPTTPAAANPFNDNMLRLLEQMKLNATPARKEIVSLSVKSGDRMLLIPLPDIAYLEAEDKYVFLVTTESQKHLTSYTIATLTERLPDTFLRVSRSTIVNGSRIREVQKHFDGKYVLLLTDKKSSRITTGSAYSEAVRSLLEL